MRRITLAILTLLLVAPVAGAEEFELGIFGNIEYDNNVLNSSEDREDGWILRVGPNLTLRRTQGDVTYDLRYQLRYEDYLTPSEIDDEFDHYFFGRGRWQITSRTSVARLMTYSSSLNHTPSWRRITSLVAAT